MAEVMLEFYDGPHATPAEADSGPVYLGIKNITDRGALDLSDYRPISEEDFAHWTRRVEPQTNDVVFTYEATLHRYALIPEGFRGCLGRRIALIRPDPSQVVPRYLHYTMLGPEWRATVTERIISGSTVDRVPIKTFPTFPISIPPLRTQQTVVEILGALDDLIENNRRRIEVLEEMAQAIYREWFVNFRYPDHEDATFIDSPLGPIPEGWEVKVLADVASLDKGLSYKGAFLTDDGVPMANLKCIRAEGGFRRDGTKPYSGLAKAKHQIVPGDIVMANTDLTQAGGVIGGAALIPKSGFTEGGIISHHLFAVRPRSRQHRHWLVRTFNDFAFREFARGVASGTTVLGLRARDVEQREIVLPGPDVAEEFERTSTERNELVETLHEATDRLASMRDLLLPKLVTGEIDVSNLDLDALVGAVS